MTDANKIKIINVASCH